MDTTKADPAIELYDKMPQPDADAIHSLIYEYLIHNCYSETAKCFSQSCQLGKSAKSGPTPLNANTNSNKPVGGMATMDVDKDNYNGDSAAMNDGDMDIDDVAEPSTTRKMAAGLVTSLDAAQLLQSTDLVADKITGSLKSLEARKHLYSLITSGNVTEALSFCNQAFPNALSGNSVASVDICFQLQCQQFIECVRKSAPDALQFAQDELGQYGHLNPSYFDTLQDIVALIAYTDPFNSPVAEYLSQSRREDVATNLNNYILSQENLPPLTTIEKIAKHATAIRDLLSENVKDKKSSSKFTKQCYFTS
ncbi:hypothetical protein HDV05_004096 [Chytridiales sp. JEL 0842]|nr:hypothetical protein HDV05_004096 [Chytridiales sp. JEL 0842]